MRPIFRTLPAEAPSSPVRRGEVVGEEGRGVRASDGGGEPRLNVAHCRRRVASSPQAFPDSLSYPSRLIPARPHPTFHLQGTARLATLPSPSHQRRHGPRRPFLDFLGQLVVDGHSNWLSGNSSRQTAVDRDHGNLQEVAAVP